MYLCKEYDLQEAEDRSDIDDDGKQLLSDLPGMYTKEVETNLTTDNFVNSDYDLNNEEYFSSDIFLNPTSLIEPTQKVMKNEPPISAGTSSNVVSQQSSSMATAYGRCPICNKKFLFSILPEHADSCLKDKQTPFICISDTQDLPRCVKRVLYRYDYILYDYVLLFIYTVPVHSHKVASWVIRTRTTIFVV